MLLANIITLVVSSILLPFSYFTVLQQKIVGLIANTSLTVLSLDSFFLAAVYCGYIIKLAFN